MRVSLGKKNKKEGTVALEGTLTQEEADFIMGIGLAEILRAGVYSIMEEQAQIIALKNAEVVGPVQ